MFGIGKARERKVITPELELFYEELGPESGDAVVLLHGWPYSPRCYDEVVKPLAKKGLRVIVPHLRGFGKTSYLSESLPRNAQQARLGLDVIELLDALNLERATLVGYDWGGRAACVAAALWPERVTALITMQGYAITNPHKNATEPPDVEELKRAFYRFVQMTPLAEPVLEEKREELAQELWRMWSPTWKFSKSTFREAAKDLQNPDWVQTTLSQYRWSYGAVPGAGELAVLEVKLAQSPTITVPSMTLAGDANGVHPLKSLLALEAKFGGKHELRVLKGVGHCPPYEAPKDVVRATLDVIKVARKLRR